MGKKEKCQNCGKKNEAGFKFCIYCAAKNEQKTFTTASCSYQFVMLGPGGVGKSAITIRVRNSLFSRSAGATCSSLPRSFAFFLSYLLILAIRRPSLACTHFLINILFNIIFCSSRSSISRQRCAQRSLLSTASKASSPTALFISNRFNVPALFGVAIYICLLLV